MKKFLFLFLFFTNLNSTLIDDLNLFFTDQESFKQSKYFSSWFKNILCEDLAGIERLNDAFKLTLLKLPKNRKLILGETHRFEDSFEILFLNYLAVFLDEDKFELMKKKLLLRISKFRNDYLFYVVCDGCVSGLKKLSNFFYF